jgi:integrase
MGIDEAVKLFLQARQSAGRSERTVEWYEQQLRCFLNWLRDQGANGTSWLRSETIEHFLAHERRAGLKASTVAARYRALVVWFGWLKIRGYLADQPSPMDRVERPRASKPVIAHVTIIEYRQFYDAIGGEDWLAWRDRAIAIILFWSGLRVAELCSLAIHDIDLTANLIVVRRGKGGSPRVVPCSPELRPVLLAYLYARPPWPGPELLLSSDGYINVRGPLSTEGVRQMMTRRCKVAGLRHLNPHAWRHGFAMSFLNAGAEMSSISAMLGHSSVKITEEVYAHWLTEGLSREYARVYERVNKR